MNSNRSFISPHEYRRFTDRNFHGFHDNDDVYYDRSAYVNDHGQTHNVVHDKEDYYVPPPEHRHFPKDIHRGVNLHSQVNSVEDDKAFATIGRAILATLNDVSYSAKNEKEKSIAKVLELHKTMSFKELVEFNNALKARVKVGMSPFTNRTYVDELTQECDKCFGDELRMLVSQKGSLSPLFKRRPNMQEDTFHRSNENGSPQRFGSDEPIDIDLTNHIIYEDRNPSSMASERTYSFDYVDEKTYPNLSTATAPSSDYEYEDKDVYTIKPEDIKRSRSPKPHQYQPKDKISPSKVRFDQLESINSPTKNRIMQSPSRVRGREIVEVIAPATLPEDFMFEARVGDQVFMVVVVSIFLLSEQALHYHSLKFFLT